MGDSMNVNLLPELSGETWVAETHLDEATSDLPPSDAESDLIILSLTDSCESVPPTWSACAGLSPELRLWHLQFGNFP